MSETVIHSLLTKDPKTLTGDCSVCGLVAIAKVGNGFQCVVKKKASQRAWIARNPAKARATRNHKSEHELFARDYVKLSAQCSICGPVTMTPWGRGYACAVRAAELRTRQEKAPQPYCRDCQVADGKRVWLKADGTCPRCVDEAFPAGARRDEVSHMAHAYGSLGFSILDIDSLDDYHDDRQPAVPGWRTIGSDRPWNQV